MITKIFFRVGEHIKFEDKKYSLFSIEIKAQDKDTNKIDELKLFAKNSNFFLDIKDTIVINIPMITS